MSFSSESAKVRVGYLNMALMAGMAMSGEQMPAGAAMPGRDVTTERWGEEPDSSTTLSGDQTD